MSGNFRMNRLARSQLYAMVWSKPLTHLAKEFDISDVGLAKVCRKHDIPLPGLGHWAKVAAGKKVKAIPLPHPEDDSQIDVGERSPMLRRPSAHAGPGLLSCDNSRKHYRKPSGSIGSRS